MITKLYALLLRLYPRRFQADFSDEMQSIFEEIVQAQSGHISAFFLLLHEVYDLPNNLLDAHAAEHPPRWKTAMKNRIIYIFGFLIMALGTWLSLTMYTGITNPETFIALVTAVFFVAIPVSSIIRNASYKIWVLIGLISLVSLFVPTTEFAEIFIISLTLIVIALLINSYLQVHSKRRITIIILALIALSLAKVFHKFYWLMIWDSTTDSLDWLWLPVPFLAIIFSSFFALLHPSRQDQVKWLPVLSDDSHYIGCLFSRRKI